MFMREIIKATGLLFIALAVSPALAGGGGVCTRGDSDSMKCMMCVVAFEGRIESYEGMKAVGQVVMTRLQNPKYPKTICAVVHQSGQFVALNRSRQLPGGEDLERIRRAAAAAISGGANGFLGFRSYGGGGAAKSIGGNHFRRTGELELLDKDPAQSIQQPRVQMATLLENSGDGEAAR